MTKAHLPGHLRSLAIFSCFLASSTLTMASVHPSMALLAFMAFGFVFSFGPVRNLDHDYSRLSHVMIPGAPIKLLGAYSNREMDMVQPLSLKSGSDLVVIHWFASKDIFITAFLHFQLETCGHLIRKKMASIIHCSIWKSTSSHLASCLAVLRIHDSRSDPFFVHPGQGGFWTPEDRDWIGESGDSTLSWTPKLLIREVDPRCKKRITSP